MIRAPPEMTVSMTPDELRSRLGRIGIWMPPPAWIGADPAAIAAAVERAGFTSIWIGGGNATADAFELLKPLLAGTKRLVVATGIANIWAWHPAQMRSEAAALAVQFPGRFVLGLGVSHEPLVTSLGHVYKRPLEKMEKFLDELDHPAHHLLEAERGELPPVVLAALGPRMLTLAAERTAGAHPYFTPPEHTAFARSVLGKSPLLVPEQALSLDAASPAEGLAAGRAYAARYLRMPNYTRNLERFGFGPDDLADGGSDRMISALIPAGAATVAERVRAHLDAGADHVVLQPLDASGIFAVDQLDDLASAVAELSRGLSSGLSSGRRSRERDDRHVAAVEFGGQLRGRADHEQAPSCLLEHAGRCHQLPGERARLADRGRGQFDDDHVTALRQVGERVAEPFSRGLIQGAGWPKDRGEPPVGIVRQSIRPCDSGHVRPSACVLGRHYSTPIRRGTIPTTPACAG
jgi:probable F420-dependent oxidoreductase